MKSILVDPEFVTSLVGSDGALIMWIDFMKWGVLSANDLNNMVNLVKKGLGMIPERSCCFAIAPQTASERRSGIREEYRRGHLELKHIVDTSMVINYDTTLWMNKENAI